MRGLYYRLANGDIGERLPLSIDNGGYVQKEADVVGIATKFYTYYQSEAGTISVMKSDELDELAATCRTLFHDKTESDLFAVPVSELQIMEYLTPNYHALYDFDDYVSRLAHGRAILRIQAEHGKGGYLTRLLHPRRFTLIRIRMEAICRSINIAAYLSTSPKKPCPN